MRTRVPNCVPIGRAVLYFFQIVYPLKPPKCPLGQTGIISTWPTTLSRLICKCVPNLVPIGPQAKTCIRLKGYTHRYTRQYTNTYTCTCARTHTPHTHTHHTLSYIDMHLLNYIQEIPGHHTSRCFLQETTIIFNVNNLLGVSYIIQIARM